MIYKNQYIKIFVTLFILCINLIFSTQVQLITAHKKSNGVLLRIVTNSIVDIENIAGWKGQENWFYLTLNGSYLSPKALEDLSFELPLLDIEITENVEVVVEEPVEIKSLISVGVASLPSKKYATLFVSLNFLFKESANVLANTSLTDIIIS